MKSDYFLLIVKIERLTNAINSMLCGRHSFSIGFDLQTLKTSILFIEIQLRFSINY